MGRRNMCVNEYQPCRRHQHSQNAKCSAEQGLRRLEAMAAGAPWRLTLRRLVHVAQYAAQGIPGGQPRKPL